MPGQWNADSDGNLAYGSVQPAVKTVLGKLKEWMGKGYIHKEAGLHDEGKAAELFSAGKAGIVAAPYWAGGWPLPAVKEIDPNADYSAYPLPAGPDGQIGRSQSGVSNGVILINKNYEHPEAFFLYANYLYNNQANPQAGSPLEYGFKEGYDYLIKDGQPTWDPEQFPTENPIMNMGKYAVLFDGARIPSLMMKTLSDLDSGKEPATAFEKNHPWKWIKIFTAALLTSRKLSMQCQTFTTALLQKPIRSAGISLTRASRKPLAKLFTAAVQSRRSIRS